MRNLLTTVPAHDTEAEESLISALLINNLFFEDIPYLEAADFYSLKNQEIYKAMLSLYKAGNPVDLVTVSAWLQKCARLEKAGGASHLAFIADAAPVALNAKAYADIIKDLSLNRKVLQVTANVQDVALKGESGATVLELLQSEALKIQTSKQEDNILALKDCIEDQLSRIEKANTQQEQRGYPTGFTHIDQCLSVRGSKLIVVAGRPKAGKTSFAITCMRNMDKIGIKTGMLSIEMSKAEIIDKILAQTAMVDSQKFNRYKALSNTEYSALSDAADVLYESKILIDDCGSLGIDDVKRKCRQMVKNGCKVLFIDQLSQIKGRAKDDRFSRYETNVNELSLLKKELRVPIFLLAQLNRRLEERMNKEPIPSDLKMTGSLEEDSDAVIFIHRPELFAQDETEKQVLKGKTVINLALNRHGATYRDCSIVFDAATSYFYQGVLQKYS